MRTSHLAVPVAIAVCAGVLAAAGLERIPLARAQFYYEQNVGQLASGETYAVRGAHHQARLTANALLLHPGLTNTTYTQIRFAPQGAAPAVNSVEAWPGTLNRYEGTLAKAFTNIPAHRRLRYANVAPSIDLIFGESGRMPSLEWVVRPGGNAAAAGLDTTATTVRLAAGIWYVRGGLLDWQFSAPQAWQEEGAVRTPVEVRWSETAPTQVRAQPGAFDASRELHIAVTIKGLEPTESAALPRSFTVDDQGILYSAASQDSPRTCTLSPSQIDFCPDALIAAYRPNGEPLFATVLAGKWQNEATSISLNAADALAIAGYTGSADFPVTPGAFQTKFGGPEGPDRRLPDTRGDAFLATLDRATGQLRATTYLGGANGDRVRLLAGSASGEITTALLTDDRFPVSAGAWVNHVACSNCQQTVLARFDAALAQRQWSSFMPFDPQLLKVANDGAAFLAGVASSPNLATTGALQTNYAGGLDAFLARFAPSGGPPTFATYWGGDGNDYPTALELDPAEGIWLALSSNSASLTLTPTPGDNAFLERLSNDGSRVLESRFFRDAAFGSTELLRAPNGKLLLSGSARAVATTSGALLTANCGGPYFARYAADGTLEFGSFAPEATNGFPNYLPQPDGTYLALYSRTLQRLVPNSESPMLVGCVVSAAGFGNSGRIVPGQIVTLFGSRIGPATGLAAEPANGAFPTTLGGVQVKVNGRLAPLLYTQAGQINAIVPYATSATAPATIEVTYQDTPVSLTATVDRARLTFFTIDGSTNGYAAALNQDGTINSPANPARRGDIVVLFGTGMGITSPPSADGAVAVIQSPDQLARPTELLIPLINGEPAQVLYLGQAPGLVNGAAQMNVRIPAALGGEADRATIRVSGGNTVSIAIR